MTYALKPIPVDKLHPYPWNVNKMDDPDFQRLCQEMLELGCTQPLQVIERPDGEYNILGGEHRWRAAKTVGIEEVPCIVLSGDKWKDEDTIKLAAFKSNALHGKVDPEKFTEFYEYLKGKFGSEQVQGLLAITDAKAFQKLIGTLKKNVKKTLPASMKGAADKLDGAKTVEDISRIVQDIFQKHGQTADKSYMVFTHAGQTHIYVAMEADVNRDARRLVKLAKERGLNMNDILGPALVWALENAKSVEPRALPEKPPENEVDGADF